MTPVETAKATYQSASEAENLAKQAFEDAEATLAQARRRTRRAFNDLVATEVEANGGTTWRMLNPEEYAARQLDVNR